MLEITAHRFPGHVVCALAGEVDSSCVAQFRDALVELAEDPVVIVDLSGVPFMDSAGLGALIGGIRKIRDNEGQIAIACNRATLVRLLQTTGFDRIVPVADTVDLAVTELARAVADG